MIVELENKPMLMDPASIANRIKSTRMLSGHTRRSFSRQSEISVATLKAWEYPKGESRNGLTQLGADRLVNAFKKCGISCTKKWLLCGEGPGPKVDSPIFQEFFDNQTSNEWDEEESILKDIESFKHNNPNSIVIMVPDNTMYPLFNYGDYVAGNKKQGAELKALIGLNCIVELVDKTIVRTLRAVSSNRYSLSTINETNSKNEASALNVKIVSAAEIVWHRWRKKSGSA